jgi:hypothetical protein
MASVVSTSALTLWAATAAAAAMLLLVALDHRKPARRHAVAQRGRLIVRPAPAVMSVEQRPSVPYRGTPWYRRLAALFGLGASGLLLGAIVGIILASLAVGAFLLVDALLQ